MKKMLLAAAVAACFGTASYAQQPQPTQPRAAQPGQTPSTQQPAPRQQQPSQQPGAQPAPRGGDRTDQVSFETADKNKDGTVNTEEAGQIAGFDFSRADTNSDRQVSRQEYQAAMATSTPREGPAARNDGSAASRSAEAPGSRSSDSASRSGEPPASRSGEAPASRSGEQRTAQVTFDTADKDKDGKVTRAEAADVAGLNFSSADVNADASLSRQEFQTAMAGAQPRG